MPLVVRCMTSLPREGDTQVLHIIGETKDLPGYLDGLPVEVVLEIPERGLDVFVREFFLERLAH